MFPFRSRRAAQPAAPPSPAPQQVEAEVAAPIFDIKVAFKSDVGCVRELNEDSVRVVRPESPVELANKGILVVVCDGMGGHAGGEVASQLAVETIGERYMSSSEPISLALKEALLAANAAIFDKAKRDSSLRGMGTTGTALVLRGGEAFYAHVGDSRLYLVREGAIYQMSEEHSAVMELVRRGLLSPEEARGHPQKNVILRALGTQPQVEVALWDEPFPLRAGDKWILCSDGLSDLVEDAEIHQAALESDLDKIGESLVALARERGGHDNISVIIAEVTPAGTSATNDKTETASNEENISAVTPVTTREVNIT